MGIYRLFIIVLTTVLSTKVDPNHLRLRPNHICKTLYLRKCGMTYLFYLQNNLPILIG